MKSHCLSFTLTGIDARLVTVETVVANGLPGLTMVGLPDAAVSESGSRVRSALKLSGYPLPPRKMVVNLAPADLKKHGSGFDLAVALGLLEAMGEIPQGCLERTLVTGELSLDGKIRAVRGVIPALNLACSCETVDRVICPPQEQALQWADVQVLQVTDLTELVGILSERRPYFKEPTKSSVTEALPQHPDLCDVIGQSQARWALEIAAAGGHHLMMVGPPGCGKSLLASCLPGILPALSSSERREVATIASVCGDTISCAPPFRAPGSSTTQVGLLGGYHVGEATRAHRGVLFLDEFPEFRRDSLESLRQVMEEGVVRVTRARFQATFPAKFTLLAAMNPCPCGMATSDGDCSCRDSVRRKYWSKLSGPLQDRFDMMVRLERSPLDKYGESPNVLEESSLTVRKRTSQARERQLSRGELNRDLRGRKLRKALNWTGETQALALRTGEQLNLSLRGLEKWLRVARTVADLAEKTVVSEEHLWGALSLRAEWSFR